MIEPQLGKSKAATPQLILIRGLPGSGKSTRASKLASTLGAIHLEADQYFINEAGEYHFDAALLSQAHLWCLTQTQMQLRQGNSVIVANTFVQHWELAPYQALAKELAVQFEILVCRDQYQNIHGVPEATLLSMKQKWQE